MTPKISHSHYRVNLKAALDEVAFVIKMANLRRHKEFLEHSWMDCSTTGDDFEKLLEINLVKMCVVRQDKITFQKL